MAASSVAAFWAVAALLVVLPGPDWAFVLSSGIRSSSVLPAVGGIVCGYVVVTIVVAAGVGTLVARSAAALTALTIVGGLYLIWQGVRTLIRESGPAAVPSAAGRAAGSVAGSAPVSSRETLARGMGVSALNPKALLLFLALLPQFANVHGDWPLAAQLGLLGGVFTATCAIFYLCLGSFARRVLYSRPGAARFLSRFSGAAMIVIGGFLLLDRFLR